MRSAASSNRISLFVQEFPALQSLIEKAFRLSEDKCYPESQGEQAGAEPTDEHLAQRVAFYLEKTAYEDFGELLILAGNGMGIGAKKTLRSRYERLVTAMFIAMNPAKARIFLDHAGIGKGSQGESRRRLREERTDSSWAALP